MYRVVKRDNSVAEFDIKKISEAIIKAFEATEKQYNSSVIDLLALKVTADFEPKIRDGRIAVEDIQDSVEQVLSEAGYADVRALENIQRFMEVHTGGVRPSFDTLGHTAYLIFARKRAAPATDAARTPENRSSTRFNEVNHTSGGGPCPRTADSVK